MDNYNLAQDKVFVYPGFCLSSTNLFVSSNTTHFFYTLIFQFIYYNQIREIKLKQYYP